MTKSLGRTYSLLDFSEGVRCIIGPGNLPRRRRRHRLVPRHVVRATLSRALRSLPPAFRQGARRPSHVAPSYFPPPSRPLLVCRQSSRRFSTFSLFRQKRTHGNIVLSHVREVTARTLFRADSCQKARAQDLLAREYSRRIIGGEAK